MNIPLNSLRPSAIAEILATLTGEVHDGNESYVIRHAIAELVNALYGNCGEDALDYMHEAGVLVEYLPDR